MWYYYLMIKALVFDIGGVLCFAKDIKKREDKNLLSAYREVCALLKGINKSTDEIYESTIDIYKKSSTGEISKEETLRMYSERLNISQKDVENLFESMYEKNTIENEVLYKFILELKEKGYKLGILSTQFHLSKKILVPEKYYRDFDALEISCDDGLKKPDLKTYREISRKLGIEFSEILFIDDKQENLDAAESLGMKSVIFRDNDQFLGDIIKLISLQ